MATGSLLVLPRFQAFKDGVFAAGALLNFYEAGTLVRRDTYSDSALTSVNANPVVCDAFGLAGPIYLLPAAYKLVATDSAGGVIFSQDNLLPSQLATFDAVDPRVCDGRLTLESGVPVSTSDQAAKTSVYFANYGGDRIALYNSTYSRWELYSFSELSIALGTDAANLGYDVFAYINAGAVAIERLAWSNLTGRATGLTTQDGVLVKSGDPTRRYLGSYRTTGTIGQTEDSAAKRYVFNYYNRARRRLAVFDTTNTWTYTTATWRQANGSTANQVEAFIGVAEVPVSLRLQAGFSNTNAGVNAGVGIKQDSVIGPMTLTTQYGAVAAPAVNYWASLTAAFDGYPAIGHHYWAWLEYSVATGTTTWYGDNGGADAGPNSGLVGWIEG